MIQETHGLPNNNTYTEQPLISVIVPVYNVKDYLNQCVQSIVNQTYRNLEIFLIDDGSADGSGNLCDEWGERDNRIYVVHSSNHGVSHARNLGLDKASGEIISFIDADDWLDLDWYEKLVGRLIWDKSDVVVGGYIRDDGNCQWMRLSTGKPHNLTSADALQEMFQLNERKLFWWELCDKIFKSDIFNGARLDEKIANAEDMLLCAKLVMNAKNVSYLPTYGYHYRYRIGSATLGGASEKQKLTSFLSIQKLWAYTKNTKNSKFIRIIKLFYLRSLIGNLRYTMLVTDYSDYEEKIRKGQMEIRNNLCDIITANGYSMRNRLGGLYFSLPYGAVILLRKLVCKKSGQ